MPAVICSLWVQKKMGLIHYDLMGRDGAKSIWEWKIFHCHKYLGNNLQVHVLLHIFFINGFFQINNFLIPPVHVYPVGRLIMWFGIGALAFREGFEDCRTWNTIERKHTPVEGRYRWLVNGILATEAICNWKYRAGTGHIIHDAVTPWYIWTPWAFWYLSMALFWVYLRFKEGHTVKYPVSEEKRHKIKAQ